MALRETVAAKRAAEVSSQLKSEFLAMISHEVRTPLGGVISMLQLAQKDGSLRADTRGKLHISLSNAEVLLQIINDILDFSRLEAGKIPLEVIDFDLPALLHDVADLLRERAESKGLSLLVEIDPALPTWWRGDPIRLRQVALNLVGNGIKFTEHGEVKLSAVLSLDGGIQIRVRDTGIGIAPEAIRRLFQKFEQADAATSREYGGTGLGLAICKHLVSAMAGQIDVCSTRGQGSEFTVRLPLHPGRPSLTSKEVLSRPHGARLHVLCAEDGHTNQIILRELLENMGHTMAMAEDGQAALEELARNDYDLLILDSRMPRMDGLTALRQLRAGADGVRDAAIPVIALTANATSEERLRFLTAGADGFLPKPIDELALHGEIARQIDLLLAQGKPLIGERSAQAAGAPSLSELDAMFGVTAGAPSLADHALAPSAALPATEARRTVLWAAFQMESPRLLSAMQDAARNGDAAALALNAHTLLGSASHFGVDAVTAHCASIERLADAGDLDAAAPHLAALKTALAAALHWQE
jgi:CheY-like chemotaxis protein